jgi:hypothetical protein
MPSSKKKTLNHFVAVWDMYGLESLHDVRKARDEHDAWEKEKIVSILKEQREPVKPRGVPLQYLILRARMNSQRNYEIYEFESKLSFDEVKQGFKKNPQAMAIAIRNVGYKIYSDRAEHNKQVIV